MFPLELKRKDVVIQMEVGALEDQQVTL